MISALAPKIVVAAGLAVVVGVIAVTVTLRSHHPTPVAQILQPPAAVSEAADAPPHVAPIPDAPAAAAPTPDATAVAVAPNDNVSGKVDDTASSAAIEAKVAGTPPAAKAHVGGDSHQKSVDETLVKNAGGVQSVEVPMPSADSGVATDIQKSAPTNELASSDSRITTELKSQFAADNISKDVDIGITTTLGAVVLTGTLVTQDAIDHLKSVAEQVKDVKSVDTSAMKIATT